MIPPKGEVIWVQYMSGGEIKFAITSTPLRDIYYLCEVKNGKLVKTKRKSQNPKELEKYIYGE